MHLAISPGDLVKRTIVVYACIICVWVLAWLMKERLDTRFIWLTGDFGSFVYWTSAKIVIWIAPAVWLIRAAGKSIGEIYNLQSWKSWLVWGGVLGLLTAITGIIPKYLSGDSLLPLQPSFALFSVLVIAPIFEELLIRGAMMVNLQGRYSFWRANFITSLMFLGLHLPGWYFMNTLIENMTKPIGGALSIFILSLVFGYAAHRGKSVMGGTLVHFLNNLASLR